MKTHILIALTKNRIMGKENSLPWSLPQDLKRFKQLTMGHPIIMGRKTYESIGRTLPGRTNIILSRKKDYFINGAIIFDSALTALDYCEKTLKAQKAFIIGGAEILKETLPLADELNLTWIEKDFEGDVYFPEWDFSKYRIINEVSHDSPFPFKYIDYEKIT